MRNFPPFLAQPFGRGLILSLGSNAAVLFALLFGQIYWPQGLPAHSQNVFWLASGVNVAGLLCLGLRYWPVILLDALPAHWIAGEPLDLTILGSGTNALEALLAAWMILRFGDWHGELDRLWSTSILLAVSLLAPLINTLIIPAYFCLRGAIAWENYGRALGNWNLSNGAAMLLVTPLLLSLLSGEGTNRGRWKELAGFMAVGAVICSTAFWALFSGAGLNLAFITFPVVIYASVRFGLREVSTIFVLVLLAVYGSLAWHAQAVPSAELASAIWFAQAFCWVLAATGLLVTALMTERRQMEAQAREEQGRLLETSLREERARLDALRYQINPHFLFNALNSLRATLPDTAQISREMVADLAGYFRSTLEHSDVHLAPLYTEMRSVRDYLAVEQRRFGPDLQVSLAATVDVENTPIPVFLLQPLVENAIRHGFTSSQGRFTVQIDARQINQRLVIEVANTGTWKEPGERPGLGLENIRQRLKLLYRDEALFHRVTKDSWVCWQIELPLNGPKHHALPDR